MTKRITLLTVTLCLAACGSGGDADPADDAADTTQGTTATDSPTAATSPVLRIDRRPGRRRDDSRDGERFRTFDGSDNNRTSPEMNEADTALLRVVPGDYGDLVESLAGSTRRSGRAISNIVSAQDGPLPNPAAASDFLWQWGQFLDHDLDLTDGVEPAEPANIAIPAGDAWFDPQGTGTVELPFNRSLYDPGTGTAAVNPRCSRNAFR